MTAILLSLTVAGAADTIEPARTATSADAPESAAPESTERPGLTDLLSEGPAGVFAFVGILLVIGGIAFGVLAGGGGIVVRGDPGPVERIGCIAMGIILLGLLMFAIGGLISRLTQ